MVAYSTKLVGKGVLVALVVDVEAWVLLVEVLEVDQFLI